MEDVLSVYSRPYDEKRPVVCMDEKPVQFFADFRKGFRSKKDGTQYKDYQYIRNGTACIFLFTEPLGGWRYADAQEHRTREDWARQIEWLLTKQYSRFGNRQPHKKVLNVERVGRNDDFYSLGGDSLSSIELISQ